ncbi:preprotein translocase subunit YajC [Streptomyces goshikiensis]|uniref:preprotein translocase subunit YajC n=1 Tax=Streptomyces goshikiensis TaxID=1942 RepID=UPI002E131114|nr:preprotein translocase subunit YajC [Streptomyces goshikiensis]
MNLVTLLPFIVLIGAMFLMTRSAKKKQQAAAQMRDHMTPGTGVRTIGGMYATVKEIGDDTVTLEVAPGVHAIFAKNAIGAVLDDEEYNRIVHGQAAAIDTPVVPDDASSLTQSETEGDAPKLDMGKKDAPQADAPQADEPQADAPKGDEPKDGKADGEAGAK